MILCTDQTVLYHFSHSAELWFLLRLIVLKGRWRKVQDTDLWDSLVQDVAEVVWNILWKPAVMGGKREEDPKTEPKVRLFSKKQKLKNNFCPNPMVKDSKNYGTAHHY